MSLIDSTPDPDAFRGGRTKDGYTLSSHQDVEKKAVGMRKPTSRKNRSLFLTLKITVDCFSFIVLKLTDTRPKSQKLSNAALETKPK